MRERVRCDDGSWTFRDPSVGESYHTPLGAAMEAREKFAAACDLPSRAARGRIVILDVCYGLGYNTAAALETIRAANPDCSVQVYGLENDPSIVRDALDLPFPFAEEDLFRQLAQGYDEGSRTFSASGGGVSFRVLVGDACERVREVPSPVDVVFFDAFSPRRQPWMWTQEFFADIRSRCSAGAVLVTYSCARAVREALIAAGFSVEDGPVVGRRGPATVARTAKHS